MNILISEMRGVGLEIAKNTILAALKNVTIFELLLSKINDMTSNNFLKEEVIIKKRRRDVSCISKISKLNLYVNLEIMEKIILLRIIINIIMN